MWCFCAPIMPKVRALKEPLQTRKDLRISMHLAVLKNETKPLDTWLECLKVMFYHPLLNLICFVFFVKGKFVFYFIFIIFVENRKHNLFSVLTIPPSGKNKCLTNFKCFTSFLENKQIR